MHPQIFRKSIVIIQVTGAIVSVGLVLCLQTKKGIVYV